MSRKYTEKTAGRLYRWLRANRLLRVEPVQKDLVQLYGGNPTQTEQLLQDYYTELIRKTMLAAVIIGIFVLAVILMENLQRTDEIHLERMPYGEDATEYSLQAVENGNRKLELQVEVPEVRYTEQELEAQFQNGFQYLEEEMPGENEDMKQITTDLNLIKSIPESGIGVRWISSDYELLEEDGTLHNQILKEPVEVALQLELSYEDEVRTKEYQLMIYPGILTGEARQKQELAEAVSREIEAQQYEADITLPKEINGYRIELPSQAGRVIAVVLTGGILIMLMLWMRKRENLHLEVKKRKQKLLIAYPGFMNQLQLYLGAGATVQGALERVMEQYERNRQTTQVLYQELDILRNEIRSGITQEEAYLRFGKRTGLAPYMRLASLLSRQLRTGGQEIRLQLEEEVQAAFTFRKEQAKKAGEEAGTKMLLPMILLMIISMVVIIIPAWKDFAL